MRKGFLVGGAALTGAGMVVLGALVGFVQDYTSRVNSNLALMAFSFPFGIGYLVGFSSSVLGVQAILRSKSPKTDAPKQVKDMLGPHEEVLRHVQQTHFFPHLRGPWFSWVLTNERVIQRKSFGLKLKKEYRDYSYADITSLTINQKILHSSLDGEVELDSKDEEVNYDVPLKDKITKQQIHDQAKTYGSQIDELKKKLEPPLHLFDLSKSDARKADGIIRENMVRFRTPFFQTPFPSDKLAYGSTQAK